MASESETGGPWERVAAELRACREAQHKAWGDVDNIAVGRYLAGEASATEREQVEQALEELPDLRLLTELVRGVLADCEPVAPLPEKEAEPAPAPVLLRFPAPEQRRSRRAGVLARLRQRSALVAAACLLLTFGLLFPRAGGPFTRSGAREDALDGALPDALASARPLELRMGEAVPPPAPARDQVARLDLLNRSVESLARQGKREEARTLARNYPAVLPAAPGGADVVLADDSDADLAQAEAALRKAQVLCERELGRTHPTTRQVVRSRATVYRVALNTPPADAGPYFALTAGPGTSVGNPYSPYAPTYPPGVKGDRKEKVAVSAYPAPLPGHLAEITPAHASFVAPRYKKRPAPQARALALREQITALPPAELRKNIVPVLLQRLKEASRAEERVALVRALGELGPAARDAVPTLTGLAQRRASPAERRAVLLALGRMGPAARPAAPVLLASLESKSAEERKCAADALVNLGATARTEVVRELEGNAGAKGRGGAVARAVLDRLQGPEGRIGIDDRGECFSVRALRLGTDEIHLLASSAGVEVLVETAPAAAPAGTAEARLSKMGPRAVYVRAARDGAAVQAHVSAQLAEEGLSGADLARALRVSFERKDFDGGLLAVLRQVRQFELRHRMGLSKPSRVKPA
jgi:hypothetical protein